jgi:hypothetical protein
LWFSAANAWKVIFCALILLMGGATLYITTLAVTPWRADASHRSDASGSAQYWSVDIMKALHTGAEVRLLADHTDKDEKSPTILILTPVKNAARHMPHYIHMIQKLTYPRNRISLGFLDSDGTELPEPGLDDQVKEILEAGAISPLPTKGKGDDLGVESKDPHTVRHTSTLYRLIHDIRAFEDFRSVTIIQHNFGLLLDGMQRKVRNLQLVRRSVLAQSRNHLLSSALRDESYVLWLDVDVDFYPEGELQYVRMRERTITSPNSFAGVCRRN